MVFFFFYEAHINFFHLEIWPLVYMDVPDDCPKLPLPPFLAQL